MRILLTNDDGLYGQGLKPLHQVLRRIGEVFLIVPDQERSGVSHSLTLIKPLRVMEIKHRTYLVNGTPADCVRFGVMSIMQGKVDLIVSGINRGQNVGADVLYSGTVAAAREGALLNIPSLAVSLVVQRLSDNPLSWRNFECQAEPSRVSRAYHPTEICKAKPTRAQADSQNCSRNGVVGQPLEGGFHFSTAGYYAKLIIKKMLEHKLPQQVYLNINVPDLPRNKIKGIAITRLGTRVYGNQIEQRTDPRGDKYYWFADENNLSGINEPGSDVFAVYQNKVSLTPLQVDLTAYSFKHELEKWKL